MMLGHGHISPLGEDGERGPLNGVIAGRSTYKCSVHTNAQYMQMFSTVG